MMEADGQRERVRTQAAPEGDGGWLREWARFPREPPAALSRGFWGPAASSSSEFHDLPLYSELNGVMVWMFMSAPLNLCVESLISNVIVFGGGWGGAGKSWGWSLMYGIGALISRDITALASCLGSSSCADTAGRGCQRTRKQSWICWHLDFGLPSL